MAAGPLLEELVAVIVAEPAATAVTTPDDETLATPVLELAHVGVVPVTVVPLEFLSVAVSVTVLPTVRLDDEGDTDTDATVLLVVDPVTVIAAVAVKPLELTVTVADPAATPVTRPVDETEAVLVLELDH